MTMEQPVPLSEVMKTTLPTSKSSQTCSTTLPNSNNKSVTAIMERFGYDLKAFMMKVTPDAQQAFARQPEIAVMGDYPTLTKVCQAYGSTASAQWLLPQIVDASLFVGAKNLDKRQQMQLAQVIATEYRHLKVTELLLFFHRFKTGRYGHFYGSVDPMVITCALRTFIAERNELIARYEQQRREQEEEEYRKNHPPMSYDEWKSKQ